ncbi:hypothetical protein Ahy_A04g018251 [Arachis hypogaea]|uniref:Aminotransferase-like plant mobile domain-containing protein n=1 Tax=Arachis hypogaea TaxID=3818 RepID=A0A445DD75_ARAHY|nr:hypothetical protein Ahy_A04g018251 [Arachis hypogaea]
MHHCYLVYTINEARNDGDINRLNKTSHYARAADFERPRLLLSRRVSHTLSPPDAIIPYLDEARFGDTVPLKDFTFDNSLISALVERWLPETHTFHLPRGEVTITLQDVAYHLGLWEHGNPVGGCLRDFGRWYGMETWAMVEQLLGAKPPVAAQQAAQRKESFTLKLVWLRDRVRQMPPTDDPETLRQYARCYIMLLIGGYLLIDKFNNLVHIHWLLFLRDFAECRALSWDSVVLAWTYQSLCLFASRVYDAPAMQSLCLHWFREEEEWGTWLSAGPLVCFNIVQFHHIDRVKRYLTTTGRGENVWWPDRLQQWYDGWRQRFDPSRRITVHHTFDTRPTREYYDWWRGLLCAASIGARGFGGPQAGRVAP